MITSEFIVIGAGVVGSATAWNLAKAGRGVTLVERDVPASGASGGPGERGARASGRDLRELPLAARAYELWPEIVAELGDVVGVRQIGGLSVGEAGGAGMNRERMELVAKTQRRFGIETQVLGADEIREMLPGINPLADRALYSPRDGVGDHTNATRTFAAAVTALGGTVLESSPVTKIMKNPNGSGMIVEIASGEQLLATTRVIVTANSYTDTLIRNSFGIDLPMHRMKPPQVIYVKKPESFTLNHLMNYAAGGVVIKAHGDDAVMVSGASRGRWNAELDRGEILIDQIGRAMQGMVRAFPELNDGELFHVNASRPESDTYDEIPIIDSVPGCPEVIFAAGWAGHGFMIAPASAEAIAQFATSGEAPGVLKPFGISRFNI